MSLDSSCRVAFAALLHDLGKFAERAAPKVDRDRLDAHITNYCKWNEQGRYHSHKHAAWTALKLDEIESKVPDLIHGDMTPFASRRDGAEGDITDSLINAAAMHHRPETLLQWIIATADRVASGFEREKFDQYNEAQEKTETGRNHYQARLLTLFEQVRLKAHRVQTTAASLNYRYPLKPLSANALFPVKRDGYEPTQNEPAQEEYSALWDEFIGTLEKIGALEKIPASHRQQWPLWLDHFDTLWQTFTHAIPSATAFGVRPEVSLYDHSKATAAFAVALWDWHVAQEGLSESEAILDHKDRRDWDKEKFLVVQGDFFGIQDFIFADGGETNKNAARILRGRSFQVSLFTELAALRVLEACELPSTSQIINAAGKFQILAPNTEKVIAQLNAVKQQLNDWFLQNTYGTAGIGLVWKAASCNDFLNKRFGAFLQELFADLENAKLQRFALNDAATPSVFDVSFAKGVCQYNEHLPADQEGGSAPFSRDQVAIGKALAHKDRLLVLREGTDFNNSLEVTVFGYRVGFTAGEEETGKFGELARNGQLVRCWDFSLPEKQTELLWHGYARRYVNAFVPLAEDGPITWDELAKSDTGISALTILKGDVDNLGSIFEKGLQPKPRDGEAPDKQNTMTFAKMAALSRQLNAFFAVWLPAFCKEKYPNTYTVFAGGDDFFLIGPWHSTQILAGEMAEQFRAFVAHNPEIHFSAGMIMTKPGYPVHTLVEQVEEALSKSKAGDKNAVTLYKETFAWQNWNTLFELEQDVTKLATDFKLSTGYIYGLLSLVDLAEDKGKPESAMWRSRFVYRTRRYVVDKLPKEQQKAAQLELIQTFGERGIAAPQPGCFRVPLFNYFYSKR